VRADEERAGVDLVDDDLDPREFGRWELGRCEVATVPERLSVPWDSGVEARPNKERFG
jgi:hypothetical protein